MKRANIPKIAVAYGLVSLFFGVASFIVEGSLDIALYDTYFVISMSLIFLFAALLFALFALISWGVQRSSKRLSPVLNCLHFGITTVSIAIILWLFQSIATSPTSYGDYNVIDELEKYESNLSVNIWIGILVIILIVSQCLFLLNLVLALSRSSKKPTLDQ